MIKKTFLTAMICIFLFTSVSATVSHEAAEVNIPGGTLSDLFTGGATICTSADSGDGNCQDSQGRWADATGGINYAGGNVGIGVATPTAKLDIVSPSSNMPALTVGRKSNNPSIKGSGASGWLIIDAADADDKIGLNYWMGGDIILANGGGNIGIGTENPSFKLDISQNNQARIADAEIGDWPANTDFAYFGHQALDHSAEGNYALLQGPSGHTFVNAAPGKGIYLRNNNINKFAITQDSVYSYVDLGIGISSPAAKLDILASGDQAKVLRLGIDRQWCFMQEGSGSATNLKLSSDCGGTNNNKNFIIETTGDLSVPNGRICLQGDCKSSWPSSTGGDNLGNHQATRWLEMNGNYIGEVDSITSAGGNFDMLYGQTNNMYIKSGASSGVVWIGNSGTVPLYVSGNIESGGEVKASMFRDIDNPSLRYMDPTDHTQINTLTAYGSIYAFNGLTANDDIYLRGNNGLWELRMFVWENSGCNYQGTSLGCNNNRCLCIEKTA